MHLISLLSLLLLLGSCTPKAFYLDKNTKPGPYQGWGQAILSPNTTQSLSLDYLRVDYPKGSLNGDIPDLAVRYEELSLVEAKALVPGDQMPMAADYQVLGGFKLDARDMRYGMDLTESNVFEAKDKVSYCYRFNKKKVDKTKRRKPLLLFQKSDGSKERIPNAYWNSTAQEERICGDFAPMKGSLIAVDYSPKTKGFLFSIDEAASDFEPKGQVTAVITPLDGETGELNPFYLGEVGLGLGDGTLGKWVFNEGHQGTQTVTFGIPEVLEGRGVFDGESYTLDLNLKDSWAQETKQIRVVPGAVQRVVLGAGPSLGLGLSYVYTTKFLDQYGNQTLQDGPVEFKNPLGFGFDGDRVYLISPKGPYSFVAAAGGVEWAGELVAEGTPAGAPLEGIPAGATLEWTGDPQVGAEVILRWSLLVPYDGTLSGEWVRGDAKVSLGVEFQGGLAQTGLTPDQPGTYHIRLLNALGEEMVSKDLEVLATTPPPVVVDPPPSPDPTPPQDLDPPPDPTSPVATVLSPNQITLQWKSGGGSSATYRIKYQSGSDAPTDCANPQVSGLIPTRQTFFGLNPGTRYTFRICAANSEAELSNGRTISATTLQGPPPNPLAWTVVPGTDPQSLLLSWTSGGGSTAGYRLSYQTGPIAPADCASGIPESQIQGTSYSMTDLTPGESYSFRVCAINGNSIPDVSSGITYTHSSLSSQGGRFWKMVLGWDHSCGLTAEGKAYCWGDNQYGQLGNGKTKTRELIPNPLSQGALPAGETWVDLALGEDHTCGLSTQGKAYCWGNNTHGQLGDHSLTRHPTPTLVSQGSLESGEAFVQITAGQYHSCALSNKGKAYCWGDNAQYQIGNTQSGTPFFALVPDAVHLGNLSDGAFFVSLGSGRDHNCGLTNRGKIYCWGDNTYGQLGDNNPGGPKGFPVEALGSQLLTGEGFVALPKTLGRFHSCALGSQGKAYCWGYNFYGQLGNNSKSNALVPTPVGGSERYLSLNLGQHHTCGVTDSHGTYCWGNNSSGQLGGTQDRKVPTLIPGEPLASVHLGKLHTCGLTAQGQGYCWGDNSFGNLGDGTRTPRTTPTTVIQAISPPRLTSIIQGAHHGCGLTPEGKAYCWGDNGQGQLGDNSTLTRGIPTAVDTTNLGTGEVFHGLALGAAHTCGLTSLGRVYCWGGDTSGQLGDNISNTNSKIPTLVSSPGLSFVKILAGDHHTCTLTAQGQAYCWGSGARGQLGNNNTMDQDLPTAVGVTILPSGESFRTLAAGGDHTCGVTNQGSTYCWGANDQKQIGDGTTTDSPVPWAVDVSQMPPGESFKKLALGVHHSCGLTQAGQVYCWGRGVGRAEAIALTQITTQEGPGGSFSDLAAGAHHTCGLSPGGKLYCWGQNSSGQLGDSTVTDGLTLPGSVVSEQRFRSLPLTLGAKSSCALTSLGKGFCWGSNTAGELGHAYGLAVLTPAPVDLSNLQGVSDPGVGDPPPNPTGLTPTGESQTQINLAWNLESGRTYALAYRVGSTAPVDCQGAQYSQITRNSMALEGLTPDTRYAFRLCTLSGGPQFSPGITLIKSTSQPPPPDPTTPMATGNSASQITVGWTSGGGSTDTYRLAYAQGGTAPSDCLSAQLTGITGTSRAVTGLTFDTQYSFRICAVNGNFTPDLSTGVTVSGITLGQAPPPNPTAPSATANSPSQITVGWTSGGGTTATFDLAYALGSTAPADCIGAQFTGIAGTSQAVTGLDHESLYSFRICAANGNATPDRSVGVTVTVTTQGFVPPPNPLSPSATANSANQITLGWTSGGGTTDTFLIAYAVGSTAPGNCSGAQLTGVTGSSQTVTGLTHETQYSFRVCAVNANAIPEVSSGVTATATTQSLAPPQNPVSPSATGNSASQITLSWTSGGGTTATYSLAYAVGATAPADCSSAQLTGITGTSQAVTGLVHESQYSFRICSANANATPDLSTGVTASATTQAQALPPNPVSPSATANSASQITVGWTSGGGTTATYSLAYVAGSVAPADCSAPQFTGIGGTSQVVTGLTHETQYAFRVCAVNANATPNVSTGVTTIATTQGQSVPPNPTSPNANADSTTQITVSWATGGGTTATYSLAYATGATAPANCSGAQFPGIASTSQVVIGLTAGTQYAFRVCAANGNATHDLSSGVTATGSTQSPSAPPNPTAPGVTGDSMTQVTLSWTTGGGSTATFQVAYALGGTAPADCSGAQFTGITSTSKILTGLTAGTQYAFRICSVNTSMDVSTGVWVIGSTLQLPPPDPTAPGAISNTSSQLTLSWTSGGGSTASYRVKYQSGASAPVDCSSPNHTGISGTNQVVTGLTAGTQYSFRICAVNSNPTPDVSSGVTVSATPQGVPPNPTGLVATPNSTTQITVSWTSGGGSTVSYDLAYAPGTTAPADCSAAQFTAIGGTSQAVTGLTAGSQYAFRICAVNGNSTPEASSGATVGGASLQGVPPNPTSPVAMGNSPSQITLGWTTGGGSTSTFLIAYAPGATAPANCSSAQLTGLTGTSQAVTGLTAATQYSFRICAANSNSTPDLSPGLTVSETTLQVAPPDPTSPVAISNTSTQITLSWTSGGGTTTTYRVKYQSGATAPVDCTTPNFTGIAGLSQVVTGLTPGTQYSFRICAANGNPTPDVSTGVTVGGMPQALPPNPTSPVVTPNSTSQIIVSWTSGGGSTASYRLAYAAGASAPANCSAAQFTAIAGTSQVVTGLTPGTQYSFRICAVNSNTTPDVSTGVTVIGTTLQVAPPNPTTPIATPNTGTQITLSWASGGGTTVTYRVKYQAGTTAPPDCTTPNYTGIAGLSQVVTGLTAGTPYAFRICAANGNPTADVSTGVTVIGMPQGVPPNPTSPVATGNSTTQITVIWTSSGGSTASYNLAYAQGATAPANCLGAQFTALSGTSQVVTGLTAATQYSFLICAVNSNTTPDVSTGTTVSGMTLQALPPDPTTPVATVDSVSQITLSWTSGGGTTATYRVKYQSGATAPGDCTTPNFTGITGISKVVTGLIANTQYSFRICAANGNPTPDVSPGVTVSGTTLQGVPPNPATPVATPNSTTQITLSWTSGGGSTATYRVQYGVTLPTNCTSPNYTGLTGTSQVVTGLTPGTQYFFRICAANANPTPDLSTGVAVTGTTLFPPPPDPTGLTVTGNSDTQATLSWGSGGGSTVDYRISYQLGAAPPTSCSVGSIVSDTVITGTSYVLAGLTSGGTYSFRVCAINSNPTPDVSPGMTFASLTLATPEGRFWKVFVGQSAQHTCGLTKEGKAYCWGINTNGQLGDGTTTNRSIPTPVSPGAIPTGDKWVDLTLGASHTCGLSNKGKAYCWGAGTSGQLGNNSATNSSTPVAVTQGSMIAGESLIQISSGLNHSCALSANGKAYCWGANGQNQLGNGGSTLSNIPSTVTLTNVTGTDGSVFISLGSGTNHNCGLTNKGNIFCWGAGTSGQIGNSLATNQSIPVPITLTNLPSGAGFISLPKSLGGTHSCGVTNLGTVYCWGANTYGQLGDNSTTGHLLPTQVSSPGGEKFLSLNLGGSHSCGLTDQKRTYCWGDHTGGKLGDNTATQRLTPTMTQNPGPNEKFLSVQTGQTHTCGLTSLGQAYCWGMNNYGQLGDNTGSNYSFPTRVIHTPLQASRRLTSLTQGGNHSCGLSDRGTAYCWGMNINGQLGDNSTAERYLPTPVDTTNLGTGEAFIQLVLGVAHTCGLTALGRVFCWGADSNGQLGDNATNGDALRPILVSASGLYFSQIIAGENHTCALTGSGQPYCWGANGSGQLGDNTTAGRDMATAVVMTELTTGESFYTLAAGGAHTCAMTNTGKAYCWGLNSNKEIGDNTTINRLKPTAVTLTNLTGGETFKRLALGAAHSCGISQTGQAYCWGDDGLGQMGNTTTPGTDQWIPEAVTQTAVTAAEGSGASLTHIAAGAYHTCGITGAGNIYCWGKNALGQLGDNTTTTRTTPVAASLSQLTTDASGQTFRALPLSLGYAHSCALTTLGKVFCWGSDTNGQGGDNDGFVANLLTPKLLDHSGILLE
jgi:alpha-tubulin suppressor-like RCC1 family protein